ncbi:MAG: flagellar hook-length control protein FliK [Fimbriimonadaceae bacterium]
METTAINLGQMLAAGEMPPVSADAQPGFAAVMELIQSGAPPGLPPPPEKEMKAGAAILEQNAGTQELDLFPSDTERDAAPNVVGFMLGFVATESLQPSSIPIPVLSPPTGTQPKLAIGPISGKTTEVIPVGQPPMAPTTPLPVAATQDEPLPTTPIPPAEMRERLAKQAGQSETRTHSPNGFGQKLNSAPLISPEIEKALQISAVEATAKPSAAVITRADLISRVIAQGPENIWPKPVDMRPAPAVSETERNQLGLTRLERAEAALPVPADQALAAIAPGPRAEAPSKGSTPQAAPTEAEEANALIPAPLATESESKTPEPGILKQQPTITASDAPKEAASLPRAQLREVVRQVSERIEHLAAMRSTETITVKLEPFELGTITLSIKASEGNVETRIAASNDQVRQALELNGAQLSRALEGKGLNLSQMSVGHQAASQSQAEAQARQPAQHRSPSPTHNPAQLNSIEAMRQMSRKATGVDLWI